MSFEKVVEFSSGKNDWNQIEIGLHHEKIVVRDEHGRLELEEDALDQLINGLDQARRRLRENQRRPTKSRTEQATTDESDEPEDDTDTDTDNDQGMPGTGLGPSMGPR